MSSERMVSNSKNGGLYFLAICILVFVVIGCIQEFSPPEVNSVESYLVVDGFLNAGNDTSIIQLRRTQNTNDNSAIRIESGAIITVSSEGGETYAFSETRSGVYQLPPVNIDETKKYRLSIKTVKGSEYLLEDVPVVITPPIDSVANRYDEGRDAMVISVNTRDPKNNTRFYRWKFEETYQYRTAYYSALEVDVPNKQIIGRKEDVHLCWKTNESASILLGTTIKLSSDEIKGLTVNVVPVNTNKFYIKYSINVKQYGLTRSEFEYWTNLSKTTQGTGTLFDPMPSLVTGNIKNVADNKELVFGYFSVSTETVKRVFIEPKLGRYPTCYAPDTVKISEAIANPYGVLLNYDERNGYVLRSGEDCADCRAQGGTIVKPAFWKD